MTSGAGRCGQSGMTTAVRIRTRGLSHAASAHTADSPRARTRAVASVAAACRISISAPGAAACSGIRAPAETGHRAGAVQMPAGNGSESCRHRQGIEGLVQDQLAGAEKPGHHRGGDPDFGQDHHRCQHQGYETGEDGRPGQGTAGQHVGSGGQGEHGGGKGNGTREAERGTHANRHPSIQCCRSPL